LIADSSSEFERRHRIVAAIREHECLYDPFTYCAWCPIGRPEGTLFSCSGEKIAKGAEVTSFRARLNESVMLIDVFDVMKSIEE
jgi:hypothetical protein